MSDKGVEDDDEAKALKLLLSKEQTRQSIAEARAAAAKADLAVAQTLLTDAETKLHAEAVDLGDKGGASLVPVVAATQLIAIAGVIADDLAQAVPNGRVLVVDDRAVAQGDVVDLAIKDRLGQFARDLAAMEQAVRLDQASATLEAADKGDVPKGAAPKVERDGAGAVTEAAVVAALAPLASLAVSALGLLKQEFTVASRDVAIDPSTLVAAVAKKVKPHGVTVVLPGFGLVESSDLFARFNSALGQRLALERAIKQAGYRVVTPGLRGVDALVADLERLRTSYTAAIAAKDDATHTRIKETIAEFQQTLDDYDNRAGFQALRSSVDAATALLTAFDAFVTAITTVPGGVAHSPLETAALREQLRDGQERLKGTGQPTYLMHVAISAQGGDDVTQSGLFWRAQKAAFLAAVQATYVVTTTEGEIVISNVATGFGRAEYDFATLGIRTAGPEPRGAARSGSAGPGSTHAPERSAAAAPIPWRQRWHVR